MGRKKEPTWLSGIKGLTAQDRKEWEQELVNNDSKFINIFKSASEEERTEAFFNTKFKARFGDRSDYANLANMSFEEAVTFWNADHDMQENPVLKYSVEPGETSVSDTRRSTDSNGIINKSFLDIFGEDVDDSTKKAIDASSNMFGMSTFNISDYVDTPSKMYDTKNPADDTYYYAQIDANAKALRPAFDNSKDFTYRAFKHFDSIANQVSPIYKNYKNNYDRLGLTTGELKDVMSYYYTILNLEGDEEANRFVADYMSNKIADGQKLGEKYKEGYKGMGASTYGTLVMVGGVLKELASGDAFDRSTFNEDLGWYANVKNNAIDNDITRYGRDIIKYQAYKKDDITALKAAGLEGGELFKTVEAQRGSLGEMIWNRDFLPSMIQQHGFTVAASMISFGSAAVAKWAGALFKAPATAISWFAKSQKAIDRISKYKEFITKASKWFGGFVGAGLAGTGEATLNGLDAGDDVREEGKKLIDENFEKWATPKLEEAKQLIDKELLQMSYDRMNSEHPMTDEEYQNLSYLMRQAAYNELREEYDKIYHDQYDRLEAEAIQAQNTTFTFNQIISGFLNTTLKSTLMHPSVTKVWGRLFKSGADDVLEDGRFWKKAWFYGKHMFSEPLGEGGEEVSSETFGAASKAFHMTDFEHYLQNGYDDVGTEGVDASWGACLSGATSAFFDSLLSKETAYSFISGAFSSGISTGNITGIYDTYKTIKDPNATKADVAKAASSIFFRSSIYEGWHNANAELNQAELTRKKLNDFMADPKNGQFHTSAVRMGTFLHEMGVSTDSEIDYRNSQLGMAVSEINALDQIKESNPIYYNTVMDKLDALETLDETTDAGKEIIEEYRNAGIAEDNSTDAEIAETIRSNAKEFKKLREKVAKKRKANERYFGTDIDSDVLDALTYGDVAYEEYGHRIETMEKEVEESFTASGLKYSESTLTKDQMDHYIKYGSGTQTEKTRAKISNEIDSSKRDLEATKKSLKKAKKIERKKLQSKIKELESKIKTKTKELQALDKSAKKSNIGEVENPIIGEYDIMKLSAYDRAKILSQEFYNDASEEQKVILDNLRSHLKIGDSLVASREENPISGDSLIKISDIAKLEESRRLHREIKEKGPESLRKYGKKIKQKALQRMSEGRIERLKDITDFEEFETIVSGLFKNNETALLDRVNAEKMLKDNANWKRYKSKQNNIKVLFEKAESLIRADKSLTREEATAEIIMTAFLADNEITIDDIASMEKLLTVENLNNYYAKTSKGSVNPQIKFSLELIRHYINTLKDGAKQVEQVKKVNEPKKPSDTPIEENKPKPEPVVDPEQDKPKENVKKEDNPNDNLKDKDLLLSPKMITDVKDDSFITEIVKALKEKSKINLLSAKVLKAFIGYLVYSGPTVSEVGKKRAKAIVLALANNNFESVTETEVIDILKQNGIEVKTQEDIDAISRMMLSIQNTSYNKEGDKYIIYGQDRTNEIKTKILDVINDSTIEEQPQKTTSASEIVLSGNTDEVVKSFEAAHNVEKWLSEHTGSPKKKVMVTVAADMPANMFSSEGVPLYFVVKDSKGTINIGGQKYQVIGVVAPGVSDNEVTNELQQMAVAQGLKEFKFISKKSSTDPNSFDNAKVEFAGFTIQSKTQQQSKSNNSIKSLITDLRQFISRIVKGTATTTPESDKITLTYESPFEEGKVITHTIQKTKENTSASREYLAFISKTGKPEASDGSQEAEVELFVHSLDKLILPSGKSFIEFLQDDDVKTNADNLGFVISSYFSNYVIMAQNLQKMLKDMSVEEDPYTGVFSISSESIKTLQGIVDSYITPLNRLLNSSVKLEVKPTIADGRISLSVEARYEGNLLSMLSLGYSNAEGSFNLLDINTKKIKEFIRDQILVGDKLRMHGKNPLFKWNVDYASVNDAKKGYAAREREINGTPLEGDDRLIAALNALENHINSGMLYISKESSERSGWGVTVHKEVHSLISKPKKQKKDTTKDDSITKEGKVDTNSGNVSDIEAVPTPVVNTTVKAELDKLVEAKKQRDKEIKDGGVASVGETASSRNYTTKGPINPVVAAVGNIYDSVIRGIINGDLRTVKDIMKNYPNIQEDEAINILEHMVAFIERFKNAGWTLDAREMYLKTILPTKEIKDPLLEEAALLVISKTEISNLDLVDALKISSERAEFIIDQLAEYGILNKSKDGIKVLVNDLTLVQDMLQNKKGVPFSGITDIVAYNEAGEIMIIDIKTFSSKSKETKAEKMKRWEGQLSDYALAMHSITGRPIAGIHVFGVEVNYNIDTTVEDGVVTDGGIGAQSITSKLFDIEQYPLIDFTVPDMSILQRLQGEPAENKTLESIMNGDAFVEDDNLFEFIDEDDSLTEQFKKCN